MSDYRTQDATWRTVPPTRAETDPWLRPGLYEGVVMRRAVAFLIDLLVLTVPVALATIVMFIFGIVTLGLGFGLFWLLSPASAIWAIVYYGASLGGPHMATWGMRAMGVQMRTLDGAPGHFVLGAAHAVLFWMSMSLLSPAVLLVALFNRRRRLLHDVFLGTVVVNATPVGHR